jgi:hypothetical protein
MADRRRLIHCPTCSSMAGRFFLSISGDTRVDHYRCDQYAHVWTVLNFRMRRIGFAILVSCGAGCADSSSRPQPTAPSIIPEYSLSGVVQDSAFRPIADVTVDIIEGARTGARATTDPSGRYTFLGTFRETIALRASKDGYVPAVKTYSTTYGGSQVLVFSLEPISPSANIAGEYTLILTADNSCTDLPALVRTRTYTATIAPSPSSLSSNFYTIALSGAEFYPSNLNNSLGVGVSGSFARILSFDYGIGIAEQLAPSTYVSIWGEANAQVIGSTISGEWSGGFEYCEGSGTGPGFYRCSTRPAAYCEASNHRVTLRRR